VYLLKEVNEKDGEGVRRERPLCLFVQLRDAGPVAESNPQGANPSQTGEHFILDRRIVHPVG